ncbi:hypothetical protein TrVE_jg5687 [Triparma verrucosa]|uniref:Uncharacterized protein n=1 Tax=Triparma verrucosa TaxID=1606542 RepID=A0A9W7FK08_9STRA|nr:hypothetical protein TrVE_jg5687 [Triparma verrucosa]
MSSTVLQELSPIEKVTRRRGSKTRATASANKRLQSRRSSGLSPKPKGNNENVAYLSNTTSPKKWSTAHPKSTKSLTNASSPTRVSRTTSIEWEESSRNLQKTKPTVTIPSFSDVNNSFNLLSSARLPPVTPGGVSAISGVTMDPAVAADNGDCSCFSWLWGRKKDAGVEELGDEMDETLIIEEQPRMDIV